MVVIYVMFGFVGCYKVLLLFSYLRIWIVVVKVSEICIVLNSICCMGLFARSSNAVSTLVTSAMVMLVGVM